MDLDLTSLLYILPLLIFVILLARFSAEISTRFKSEKKRKQTEAERNKPKIDISLVNTDGYNYEAIISNTSQADAFNLTFETINIVEGSKQDPFLVQQRQIFPYKELKTEKEIRLKIIVFSGIPNPIEAKLTWKDKNSNEYSELFLLHW